MKPKNILVIRLSSLGDVAMTVPVLHQLLLQHTEIRLTILTQAFLAPLFEPLERTTIYPVLIKGKHKGVTGLFRLYNDLKKENKFDAVVDLHNVLRSKLICFLFRTTGIPCSRIDKGRKEKRMLTSKKNKKFYQLKTTFQRYADVFTRAGLPVTLDTSAKIFSKRPLPDKWKTTFSKNKKNILIAPFAGFNEKIYPLEKTKTLIQQLNQDPGLQIYLLGYGEKEIRQLKDWEKEISNVINLSEQFTLREELAIISNMDLVICMDSGNMHLASLFGVPVVSVWGATHPFAGFYGWGQNTDNAVQIELYCRPCSVYGNKPCYRGDHACMTRLKEQDILEKINAVLFRAS